MCLSVEDFSRIWANKDVHVQTMAMDYRGNLVAYTSTVELVCIERTSGNLLWKVKVVKLEWDCRG